MDLHQIDGKYFDLIIITIIRCIVLINKLTSFKVVLNSCSYRKGNLGSTPTLFELSILNGNMSYRICY